MKKICCAVMFFLCGCASTSFYNAYIFDHYSLEQKIVYAQKIKVDVFWEWGLFRVVGHNLYVKKGFENNIDKVIANEKFCGGDNSANPIIGSRLYLNNNQLAVECLYELSGNDKFVYREWRSLFSNILEKQTAFVVYDGRSRIIHNGNSLDVIKDNNNEYHNLIQKEYWQKEFFYEESPVYELSFKYDDPVYSFSFITDSKKYKGYSLLKIDSSLLPLESPKYKALKQAENMRID